MGKIRTWIQSLMTRFAKKPSVHYRTIHKDNGQAMERVTKELAEYRRHFGVRDPKHLVIGVDLYEQLVIHDAQIDEDSFKTLRLPYHEEFMGIPLVVVPQSGVVWATGDPRQVMLYERWRIKGVRSDA